MSVIDKIGIAKKYKNKLNSKFERLEDENLRLATENIDLRLKIKKINRERVNVIFVCHRPAVWESLRTVYESLKNDNRFSVSIVAIPNKKELPKLGLNHEIYESEGAEEFWKPYGCVNGYNYETKEWLDLRNLDPDYVFFQQPYNITRCEAYKSWHVSRYAKLLYVSYFGFVSDVNDSEVRDTCYPMDFIRDVSFYFAQTHKEMDYFSIRCKNNNDFFTNIFLTGYPKYDEKIKNEKGKSFCFLWTPRWTTNENSCNFFDYKDRIVDFIKNQANDQLIFRPHPQMWLEFESTGEFTHSDRTEYLKKYNDNDRLYVDTEKEYIDSFNTSNCLISDISSMIPQYFISGKPIIFCDHKNSTQSLVKHKGISDGIYFAENWSELRQYMEMLSEGKDPLKSVRKDLIDKEFYNLGNAGNAIKDIISADAFK